MLKNKLLTHRLTDIVALVKLLLMQLFLKTSSVFILLLTVTGCSDNKRTTSTEIQGDSLKIITDARGDTVIKQYIRLDNKIADDHSDTIIYFTKTMDTTIVISNFFFEMKGLRIYFNKQKVIDYCDSIIQHTPPDQEGGGYVNWSLIEVTQGLREAARSDKEMEIIRVSWLPDLLERFNPMIINAVTKQRSKTLLKRQILSKYGESRTFSAISLKGDTSFIWYERDFNEVQLRETDH